MGVRRTVTRPYSQNPGLWQYGDSCRRPSYGALREYRLNIYLSHCKLCIKFVLDLYQSLKCPELQTNLSRVTSIPFFARSREKHSRFGGVQTRPNRFTKIPALQTGMHRTVGPVYPITWTSDRTSVKFAEVLVRIWVRERTMAALIAAI